MPSMSIDDLLIDHQEFHSDLQMDAFITVRSGGTLYGCYKQALRELSTRKMAIIGHITAMKLSEIDARAREKQSKCELKSARNKAKNEEFKATLSTAEHVLDDRLRECMYFYGQARAIRDALDRKGIKFPLGQEARRQLDEEMWEHQLKAKCAVEFMSQGQLSVTTLELVQSCPRKIKTSIFSFLTPDKHDELITWFMNYEVELPSPSLITRNEMLSLINYDQAPLDARVAQG